MAKYASVLFKSLFATLGVAHLWKNEGVAPLRELLYIDISETEARDEVSHIRETRSSLEIGSKY